VESWPVMRAACCVLRVAWFFFRDLSASVSAGRRHSRIKVLLPEPLTPVTSTRRANGKSTLKPFKLFLRAPLSVSQLSTEGDFGLWPLSFGLTTRLFPRLG